MPGFYHPLSVWRRRMQTSTSTSMHNMIRRDHSAYALGLQGPDLFFYYLPSYLMHRKNIGDLAHRKDTGQFFGNLLQSRKLLQGKKTFPLYCRRLHLWIYAISTLDCTIHPYVYAFTGYNAQTPPSIRNILVSMLISKRNSIPNFYMRKSICILPQFHQNATIRLTTLQRKSNCTDAVLCLPEHLSGNFRKVSFP